MSRLAFPRGTEEVLLSYLPPRSHCYAADDLAASKNYKYLCLGGDLEYYNHVDPPASMTARLALFAATDPASLDPGAWCVQWDPVEEEAYIDALPGAAWDGGHFVPAATHVQTDLGEGFPENTRVIFRSKCVLTPGWQAGSVPWRAMDGSSAKVEYQVQTHAVSVDEFGAVSIASGHTDADHDFSVSPAVDDTEKWGDPIGLAEPSAGLSLGLVLGEAYSDRDCLGD